MRYRAICLFTNLFVCFLAKSQQTVTSAPYAKPNIIYDSAKRYLNARITADNAAINPRSNTLIKTVPATFYYNSLGFFCQKELQLEKTLRFPVKLRLGSVAYTDEMEGKGKKVPFSVNGK